jgi:hypothetical protein
MSWILVMGCSMLALTTLSIMGGERTRLVAEADRQRAEAAREAAAAVKAEKSE